MTYNMTQLQESTTMFKLVEFANDATGEILVGLFMIGLFFIIIMAMKRQSFEYSLMGASGVSFILSAVLANTHLLNFIFPLIFLIMFGLTTLYVFTVNK